MMTIISNTNVKIHKCMFVNFLQHSFQILLISAYIRLFNVNTFFKWVPTSKS